MMSRYPYTPESARPNPAPPVGDDRASGPQAGVAEGDRLSPDTRDISARAVRYVWETMCGRQPAVPAVVPRRLPPDLVAFAAAKGSLGALMAALGYWGLSDALAKEEMRKARLTLTRTAMATAAMRRELTEILGQCAKRDIEVVLFKGHDLITACYHDDSIRPVTDADLLVRENDYPRLGDLLESAGYRRGGGGQSGVWSRGGLIIDVHLRFVGDMRNPASAYLPRIESDEIFDSSIRREIEGVPYLSPDPRHSLILTALHALTHSYLMDYWFMDAGALLIANTDPSFADGATDIALRHRLSSVLNYHLWAIREIFGFPGPLPLPVGYRPPRTVGRLIRAAVRRTDYLFFGDVLLGLAIDTNRRKFYYFRAMAFPHPDVMAREMDVDPRKRPAVYLARLTHLVGSGLRALFAGRR